MVNFKDKQIAIKPDTEELSEVKETRPLQNAPFCPISASDSNFNPQNTQCIPVVKIFAFLGLEQSWTFYEVVKLVLLTHLKIGVKIKLAGLFALL